MVSAFTPARRLEEPARGDQVGTWDTPVNNNMSNIDAGMGQNTSISVSAGSIVLSAPQFQCSKVTLFSTLLANITITFPTSFTGPYIIHNATTGSSQFTITMQTTVAGSLVICAKPGEIFDIFNDGINMWYRNLPSVGSYWDYAGSSVPSWVSGCTIPPYLVCDGTPFSSATYPALAAMIGTTLPDARGRFRTTLNSGTGRITSSGGLDGNTAFASGGIQLTNISSQNLPDTALSFNDPGHSHSVSAPPAGGFVGGGAGQSYTPVGGNPTGTSTTGITIAFGSTTPAGLSNIPPAYVGGITMIRAA